MAAIHLIEKGPTLVKKVPDRENEYESGNWTVSVETAERLVGGDLYLHPRQDAPSDYGGRIVGYRVHEEGSALAGRVVFRFVFSQAYRGVISRDGWGKGEKKYVW